MYPFDTHRSRNATRGKFMVTSDQRHLETLLFECGDSLSRVWLDLICDHQRGLRDSPSAHENRSMPFCLSLTSKLLQIGAVRMREALRFDGVARKVVVTHDGRRWFASVAVETEAAPHIEPEVEACGIDVGITTLASVAYSNGERETIANPKPLAGALADLRRVDKTIARSKNMHGTNKTSNRRLRLYTKRRRLHARIRDIRADHRHKTTTAITKRCGQLSVETLNVAAMMRNKRVARSLADTSMSGWLTTLEHKADFHGRRFNKADRWLPSSKTCSECGEVKAALSLSERQYLCDECGHTDDRDFNAVHNLLAEVQPKRGGDISPDSNSSPAVPTKRKLQTA